MEEEDFLREQKRTGDTVLSVLKFKLSPDVPPELQREFDDFQFSINKLVPQGNYTENDILILSMMFDQIVLSLQEGLYDLSRIYQYKFLHLVQSSRGRDGQYAILESRTRQYQEISQKMISNEERRKKRLMDFIRGKPEDDNKKEEQ